MQKKHSLIAKKYIQCFESPLQEDSGWAVRELTWCNRVSKAQYCFGGQWVSHWWKTNKWVITLTEWLGYGIYSLQNPSEVSVCWLQQGKILSGHHDHYDLFSLKFCYSWITIMEINLLVQIDTWCWASRTDCSVLFYFFMPQHLI